MLNSYRGWESAGLRESERHLPQQADEWLDKYSRFVIVTATEAQVARLRGEGWYIERLGKGEDASIMICMSRHYRPGWLTRLFGRKPWRE